MAFTNIIVYVSAFPLTVMQNIYIYIPLLFNIRIRAEAKSMWYYIIVKITDVKILTISSTQQSCI